MNNNEIFDNFSYDKNENEFVSELASTADASATFMAEESKRVLVTMVEYKELMMMYSCAMKEVMTKFDVLNTEFNVRYRRNPISSMSKRLKRTSSIMEKLMKHNHQFTVCDIEEYVHDVAGVRVICSYIDDIYRIAEALLQQDDIILVERKDYIANPKPNGYRSLHLIVKVPVFFSDQTKEMKVEVQIRTIAMDFWASLEHQLKYKQNIPNEKNIITQLKMCAEASNATDEKMLDIRRQIEDAADIPTEEDILLEKICKLDEMIT